MKNIFILVLIVLISNQVFAQNNIVGEANNKFAIDLLQKISEKETGNIFFSPISLTAAIGMTSAGAKDVTLNQIEKVFHFPHNDISIHKMLGKFQKQYQNLSSDGVEVSMVNKLWAEKTFKINKNYCKQITKDYSSTIELIDFIQQPDNARIKINSVISDQTKKRIIDLLPDGSINSMVRLIITNAIYFKGNWQTQFDSKKTKDADFFITPEKKVVCQMMSVKGKFKFFEGNNYSALELPYKGESLSMLIILPSEGTKLDSFQKGLTYNTLKEIEEGISSNEVWVLLPRFKSSTGYQLKPILSEMGMPNPFSNDANFSIISPKNDLKIFDIYHKAFVPGEIRTNFNFRTQ